MKTSIAFRTGQRNFLRGDYDRSIIDFNSALAEGFDSSRVHEPMGFALLKKGDFLEAVEAFSRALDLDSTNDRLFFLRGMAHFNNGNTGKALDDLNEAIRFNSRRGAPYVARSLAFKALKRDIESENDLKSALTIADVEVELFISEYCIAPTLYHLAMSLFDVERAGWGKELRGIRSDRIN
jgi:tetratricopeptide (TPR) repeat protein